MSMATNRPTHPGVLLRDIRGIPTLIGVALFLLGEAIPFQANAKDVEAPVSVIVALRVF